MREPKDFYSISKITHNGILLLFQLPQQLTQSKRTIWYEKKRKYLVRVCSFPSIIPFHFTLATYTALYNSIETEKNRDLHRLYATIRSSKPKEPKASY